MAKFLSILILKLIGWKEDGKFPDGDKFVVVAAPHTSMFDFILGKLHYNSLGKSVKFMIKEKYFFFPAGVILKMLGAIPVYASSKSSMTEQMIKEFEKRDQFLLTITPEATRKRVKRWKRGFYYIAKGANVPIVLGYLDYHNKTLGVKKVFETTEDIEADMIAIKSIYKSQMARHPKQYNQD
ncbi:MAG: 1-acyl-sn-glycerol-3-phosphate acyltransferase [Bacteroidales bacterium]|nr:1-acyl-sn-glycerol-3-phosphate acyltransferase [Bacteroidales bacterium]